MNQIAKLITKSKMFFKEKFYKMQNFYLIGLGLNLCGIGLNCFFFYMTQKKINTLLKQNQKLLDSIEMKKDKKE